jgi:hypothetical protein
MESTTSNRTSQQVRFNKKKTGKEEDFVLDFVGTPRVIKNLFNRLAKVRGMFTQTCTVPNPQDIHMPRHVFEEPFSDDIVSALPSDNRQENFSRCKVHLEVPVKSSPTFIFGYADIVVPSFSTSIPVTITVAGEQVEATYDRHYKGLLIEVKSERGSVLDLIKQLKSYSEFYRDPHQSRAVLVFIHLYDLEDREILALRQNGILPIDGRTLLA